LYFRSGFIKRHEDPRQPFDFDRPSLLFLSVSNHGDENIFVNGKIEQRITKVGKKIESIPGKFKFVAGCLNENILYGFSNSNAFLISFNGFAFQPSHGYGYYPGQKTDVKPRQRKRVSR
jgi:hypothetical protein